MTLDEFKAWLDGFTERGQLDRDEMMVDFPSPDEWSTISAKLATVEDAKHARNRDLVAEQLLEYQARLRCAEEERARFNAIPPRNKQCGE